MNFILKYIKKYLFFFVLMFLCVIITTFISTLYPSFLGKMLDSIIYDKNISGFLINTLHYAIVFFIAIFAQFFIDFSWAKLNLSFLVDIKSIAFNKIIRLKGNSINNYSYGDFMTRINYDSDQVLSFIHGSIFHMIACILMIILSLNNVFSKNIYIGVIIFIGVPLTVYLSIFISKKIKKYYFEIEENESILKSFIMKVSQDIWNIKLILSPKRIKNYSRQKIGEINMLTCKVSYYTFISERINTLLLLVIQLIVFLICSIFIMQETITIGDFVAIYSYYLICVSKFNFLNHKFTSVKGKIVSLNRLFELYNEEEEYISNNVSDFIIEKGIYFNNITFFYSESKAVLDNVTFSLDTNCINTIIGENGSGKSTIINMIGGLFETQIGEIRFDSKIINEISYKDLRNNIAIIHQESLFFNSTIRFNLLLDNNKERDKEIWDVLERVELKKRIQELPNGLDTVIDEKFSLLSGGQKQKFSFCRALLKNAKILILDEAFSALDEYSIKKMMDILVIEKRNKLIIMIAHDKQIIDYSDKYIILNKNGCIECEGDLTYIRNNSLLYFKLFC